MRNDVMALTNGTGPVSARFVALGVFLLDLDRKHAETGKSHRKR